MSALADIDRMARDALGRFVQKASPLLLDAIRETVIVVAREREEQLNRRAARIEQRLDDVRALRNELEKYARVCEQDMGEHSMESPRWEYLRGKADGYREAARLVLEKGA